MQSASHASPPAAALAVAAEYPARAGGWGSLLLSGAFWGGVTLVSIWLAVLFVGIFGGNIETAGTDGSRSSWPVVAVVAIAALFATISVGRWGFRSPDVDENLRKAVEDERRAVEELTAQVEELRSKLPPS